MYHFINHIKLDDAKSEAAHGLGVTFVCTNFEKSTARTTTFMSTGSYAHAENSETLHLLDAKVIPPVFCCNSMPNFKFLI
jgi:hypothetical protein